jgi:hypothetical protein
LLKVSCLCSNFEHWASELRETRFGESSFMLRQWFGSTIAHFSLRCAPLFPSDDTYIL